MLLVRTEHNSLGAVCRVFEFVLKKTIARWNLETDLFSQLESKINLEQELIKLALNISPQNHK